MERFRRRKRRAFTFRNRNSEPSEAIRSEVEKQAKRLEKFHDRITSCHVTVIAPTMKRR
ncbi:MAG: HPF/RaiA family ribosome-associated protein, partial [Methylocella sp.]